MISANFCQPENGIHRKLEKLKLMVYLAVPVVDAHCVCRVEGLCEFESSNLNRVYDLAHFRDYETKSFEELRIEDYAANRRGKVVPFAVTTHIDVDLGI